MSWGLNNAGVEFAPVTSDRLDATGPEATKGHSVPPFEEAAAMSRAPAVRGSDVLLVAGSLGSYGVVLMPSFDPSRQHEAAASGGCCILCINAEVSGVAHLKGVHDRLR